MISMNPPPLRHRRTVAAPPEPRRHVVPHAVQADTDASPFSGSVVPSWSQRSNCCSDDAGHGLCR